MSDPSNFNKQGEEEEEDELDETFYKHAKDAVLFAIDVSESMLTPPPKTGDKKADIDSPLSAAIKCAFSLMQQRIISNPNDMMGVVLYGTEQTKGAKDEDSEEHVYLLTDLCIPAATDVKALKDLVENEDDFNDLMVPSPKKPPTQKLLFYSLNIFATRAANFASRRLFIVTDKDDPDEKKEDRNSAINRAKDLYDLGVTIELFPIGKHGESFDKNKFFNDIIYDTKPTNPQAPAPLTHDTRVSSSGNGITLLSSLLSSINSKAVPKRAYFSNMPFEIGPGFTISVKGYIIFKRQEIARSCYVWLNGEKAQLVKGVTTRISEHEGGEVDKAQIRKAYRFGGTHIVFTPEELKAVRHFGDPVIRIIGFKPINSTTLPIWANINRATFLYPSEEEYIGSTRVFSALHQKLLNDKKMGLAWHIPRNDGAPTICAVLPGAENLDDTGEQYLPPGLWLLPLPFADDIRDNPPTPLVPASEELTDKMRLIVQQLQLPKGRYAPSRFPNPQLQWHYLVLQRTALGEAVEKDELEDKTTPRYKQIHKRAGEYVLDWRDTLESEHKTWRADHGAEMSLPKRPASSGKSGSAAKRIKTEDGGPRFSDRDIREAWKNQVLGKLTVADLRAWMTTKALDTTGKKAELLERVENWFESQ